MNPFSTTRRRLYEKFGNHVAFRLLKLAVSMYDPRICECGPNVSFLADRAEKKSYYTVTVFDTESASYKYSLTPDEYINTSTINAPFEEIIFDRGWFLIFLRFAYIRIENGNEPTRYIIVVDIDNPPQLRSKIVWET